MVAPDRGRVELDLRDDRPPLVLWFPNAAISELCKKLGEKVAVSRSRRLIDELLTYESLHLYVWAGRLWEDRKASVDEMRERVGWSSLEQFEIMKAVRRALFLAITGSDPSDEPAEEPADPQKPTALNGAGTMPSDTPPASSDSV